MIRVIKQTAGNLEGSVQSGPPAAPTNHHLWPTMLWYHVLQLRVPYVGLLDSDRCGTLISVVCDSWGYGQCLWRSTETAFCIAARRPSTSSHPLVASFRKPSWDLHTHRQCASVELGLRLFYSGSLTTSALWLLSCRRQFTTAVVRIHDRATKCSIPYGVTPLVTPLRRSSG